jgi:hypothetical protein
LNLTFIESKNFFSVIQDHYMRIDINNHRKVFAIQEEFTKGFHNLQLSFHQKPSKPGGTSSDELVESSSKTLAACRAIDHTGFISISPEMTVGELKQHFSDVFELTVDVYHRTGKNTWSDMPVTENETLNVLNSDMPVEEKF